MISVVVWISELIEVSAAREIVVRSLVWLVSAVVAGVVRDVTIAAPLGCEVGEIAEHAGCNLVEREDESERLRTCVVNMRSQRVLVILAGFQPGGALAEEIDQVVRRASPDAAFLLLAAPLTAFERLFAGRTRIVGVLATKQRCLEASGFRALTIACKRGHRLRTRALPILR